LSVQEKVTRLASQLFHVESMRVETALPPISTRKFLSSESEPSLKYGETS
jgi:hypothetical protein